MPPGRIVAGLWRQDQSVAVRLDGVIQRIEHALPMEDLLRLHGSEFDQRLQVINHNQLSTICGSSPGERVMLHIIAQARYLGCGRYLGLTGRPAAHGAIVGLDGLGELDLTLGHRAVGHRLGKAARR
jgi:hypothetical protein